jgi:hypothetical protein
MGRLAAIAVFVVVILATAGFKSAPSTLSKTAEQETLCDDTSSPVNGDVTGNLEVEENAVCHIHGWTISGNVKVEKGAKLFTRDGTHITGSVNADHPQQVNIEAQTSIGGSFKVEGTNKGAFGGFICGSQVIGNVSLEGLKSGTWVIGEPSDVQNEGGQFEGYDYSGGPSGTDPDLTCELPNTVGGWLKITKSDDVNRLEVAFNNITGNVTVSHNDVFNEFIELEQNKIGGSLSCHDNEWDLATPAVSNGGQANSVTGTETGQCAGL